MMIPSTFYQTPLKLHLAQIPNQNLITGYGSGYVLINGQRYENSLIVTAKTIVPDWTANFEDALDESHLVPALRLAPQIIVIGSGIKLQFPKPAAFADMMREAGFRRVSHQPLTGGVVAIHSGWKL